MPGRFTQIVLGYSAACFAGGVALTAGLAAFALIRRSAQLGWPSVGEWALVVSASLLAALMGGAIGIVPSLLAIPLAERSGLRWPGAYLLFGAALGVAGYLVYDPGALGASPMLWPAAAFAGAGAAGGLVYHRLAGRHAGGQGQRPPAAARS